MRILFKRLCGRVCFPILFKRSALKDFLSFAESSVVQGAAFQLSKASFDAVQDLSIFWEGNAYKGFANLNR